jgi:hypothetical protein
VHFEIDVEGSTNQAVGLSLSKLGNYKTLVADTTIIISLTRENYMVYFERDTYGPRVWNSKFFLSPRTPNSEQSIQQMTPASWLTKVQKEQPW